MWFEIRMCGVTLTVYIYLTAYIFKEVNDRSVGSGATLRDKEGTGVYKTGVICRWYSLIEESRKDCKYWMTSSVKTEIMSRKINVRGSKTLVFNRIEKDSTLDVK